MSFANNESGFNILHDIGIIIAIISGFVFSSIPQSHYIVCAVMIGILSMVTAAIPYYRLLFWPIAMILVISGLVIDPTIIMDFLLGEGPNSIIGIGVGWVYIALGFIACAGLVHAARYSGHEKLIYGIMIFSFLVNEIKRDRY